MAERKNWWLISYDIRSPARWRKAYKLLKGNGERLQYSVFRCRLNTRELERLRWELARILTEEDDLLIIGLCNRCVERIVARNRAEAWPIDEDPFLLC
ncbi:CRISPR-associated endonuclease Cas2 [Gloeobacter morelensis]|uniref:CRISPR-associated endoribonuclease Cas2 n=1 Tax=Gloeobacter morelensis MG652769 TaxID=2781736 RepID=A0ABY3PQI3_9CYAN|nr:CRISPR-associated endonuclease Cas2 [Gloeobacter morelensis]UFP95951.1 CRISPR-associated endonuclease Cas2 [Gloeobacter morelensis MG652769]